MSAGYASGGSRRGEVALATDSTKEAGDVSKRGGNKTTRPQKPAISNKAPTPK